MPMNQAEWVDREAGATDVPAAFFSRSGIAFKDHGRAGPTRWQRNATWLI
jgi:hypothetical protein